MNRILVGSCEYFAIESYADEFIASESQMAVGYFVIYADGKRYGVHNSRACVLGNSYDEVISRIKREGTHKFISSSQTDAIDLAIHVVNFIYDRGFQESAIQSEWKHELDEALYTNSLVWAPDGDAAFDDGSHVIQIDEGENVRIVAFVNAETQNELEESVADIRIERDAFYDMLRTWSKHFDCQWRNSFHSVS